jgi:hypothetical protein
MKGDIPWSPLCTRHSSRIGASTFLDVFCFFDHFSGRGMSFLPHPPQCLEWLPFSVWQCLQILILVNEIVLIK